MHAVQPSFAGWPAPTAGRPRASPPGEPRRGRPRAGTSQARPAAARSELPSLLWLALFLAGAPSVLAATAVALRADYQFQDTLDSSVPGAPTLVNLGPNTFGPGTVDGLPRTVLSFAKDDGLLVPGPSIVPNNS